MAIDPKLVSIIPASQLPTGDPTNAADFLFYEGDALKKGSMSNIYDKVTSGIKGVATQTNAPTAYTPEAYPNGLFETYVVRKPLTLPNSWGSAVTQAELDANNVYFDVENGVISKQLSEKRIPDLVAYGLGPTYPQIIDESFTGGTTGASATAVLMFIKEIDDVDLTKITSVGDNITDTEWYFINQYRIDGDNYEKIASVPMETDKSFDLSGLTLEIGDWLAVNNTNAFGTLQIQSSPGSVYKYKSKATPTENVDVVPQTTLTAYPYVYSLIWEYTRQGAENVPEFVETAIKNTTEIRTIAGYYDIISDEAGNVLSFVKTFKMEMPLGVHTLKDDFSQPIIATRGGYDCFPGIVISKKGVIHVPYRSASGHVSMDASIKYIYSKDFGKTWSDPVVWYQGDVAVGEWFLSYGNNIIRRMSNGQYLFATFSLQIKPFPGGWFDMKINPDPNSRQIHNLILEEDSEGVLQIVEYVEHTLKNRLTSGGTTEYNGVMYQLCYREILGPDPDNVILGQESFLIKSTDFGLTWTDVGLVHPASSEGSIEFIGDTLFALLRPEGPPGSPLMKSTDFGVTWTQVAEVKPYHGIDIKALGDNLLVCGRQPPHYTTFDVLSQKGEYLIDPVYFFGEVLDSGYGQIAFFEQYVFVAYYNMRGGVYENEIRYIEKSKLLNL